MEIRQNLVPLRPALVPTQISVLYRAELCAASCVKPVGFRSAGEAEMPEG